MQRYFLLGCVCIGVHVCLQSTKKRSERSKESRDVLNRWGAERTRFSPAPRFGRNTRKQNVVKDGECKRGWEVCRGV